MLQALHSLFELEEKGNLIIEDNVEDIYSQVEKKRRNLEQLARKYISDDCETTKCLLTSGFTHVNRLTNLQCK
jgi:hypothetical protein